ncbi:carcinoembryonic antigen-related cell adhesion molecule 5-like [Xenia sp. Carnegie-2017]|uniref:carcinoembryonic antigen-related cell adhesion molecule 5-like n=1 Tax=Xenia sp. Carnegie-2017 TaxID=2897299 RepID=UPI001F03DB36|nr:carcinoembryonic antigen-related cell adhesion molecule 5-like [Xenia sp. Carnegie-2017]
MLKQKLDVLILMLLTMSINVPFMISIYLWCMAFFLPCDGNILSPPSGTNFTFLPGEIENITWIFNVSLNAVASRNWRFKGSSNGSPKTLLATVILDLSVINLKEPILPKYDVYKPSTLRLRNITYSYDGTYEFELTRRGGASSFISKVRVFVAKKPTVGINCSTPLVVSKGDNVSCVCKGEGGNPPANVTWFDKDNNITGDVGVVSKTLVITNVTVNDGGNYRCKAESFNDSRFIDEKSIEIQVKFKPTVSINCSSLLFVNESDSVSCVCKGEGGIPPANVTWFDKDNNTSGDVGVESAILVITGASPNDRGSYRCKAESFNDPRFIDEKSIEIIVNYQPRNTTITLSKINPQIGESANITCESDGFPPPTFIIFHNGAVLSNNKTYIIHSVNFSNAGLYRCEAKNKLGNDLSDVKNLTVVNEAPVSSSFSLSPSIITSSMTFTFTSSISSTSTTNAPISSSFSLSPSIITSSMTFTFTSSISSTSTNNVGPTTKTTEKEEDGPNIALIVGIAVGAVFLVAILVFLVIFCYRKSKQRKRHRDGISVKPVVGDNNYELDGAPGVSNESHYESVKDDRTDKNLPVGESKPSDSKPPVYASINRENRQGNPLYSSLDPKDAPKRDPTQKRPAPTEYASIDMSKLAPVEKKDEKKGDNKEKDEKKKDVVYI